MTTDPGIARETSGSLFEGREATVPILTANAIGIGILLAACSVFLPVFLAIWGQTALLRGALRFVRLEEMIPIFAVLIVMHELLHAAGFLWLGRVDRRTIRFGVQWKTLTPYAHCSAPLPAKVYRIAVVLPGLLLGIMPCIIAVTIGSGWLLIWGILMTMAAGGDAAIIWAIRSVPGIIPVLDHPTKAGCLIGVPASTSISTVTSAE